MRAVAVGLRAPLQVANFFQADGLLRAAPALELGDVVGYLRMRALNLMVRAIAPSLAPVCGGLVFVAAIIMTGGPQVWRRLSIG